MVDEAVENDIKTLVVNWDVVEAKARKLGTKDAGSGTVRHHYNVPEIHH